MTGWRYLDGDQASGIFLAMVRERLQAAKYAILGLTVTCLTGGPVISAVHAKSCDRAQRPCKPVHQPHSRSQPAERILQSLVTPQVAKLEIRRGGPSDRRIEIPQEALGVESSTINLPLVLRPADSWLASKSPRVAPSPPFDALAPPIGESL